MSTVTINIGPEYIRAAIQSAVGRNLKFPSLAAEEHIARFLSRVNWLVVSLEHPAPTPGVHAQDATNYEPELFIIQFPMDGRWVRSADYPETYTSAEASGILSNDLSGLKVGYRVANLNHEMERFIIEFEFGTWVRSRVYPDVYSREVADDILARTSTQPFRKTVYL